MGTFWSHGLFWGTLWLYVKNWATSWTNFKWLPTVMGGYIWGTRWSYNPNTPKMFPPVPDRTHVVGAFQMCPICYYHEIAGLIQSKLSMFSTCNHWFQAPSPPVNVNAARSHEYPLRKNWRHCPSESQHQYWWQAIVHQPQSSSIHLVTTTTTKTTSVAEESIIGVFSMVLCWVRGKLEVCG